MVPRPRKRVFLVCGPDAARPTVQGTLCSESRERIALQYGDSLFDALDASRDSSLDYLIVPVSGPWEGGGDGESGRILKQIYDHCPGLKTVAYSKESGPRTKRRAHEARAYRIVSGEDALPEALAMVDELMYLEDEVALLQEEGHPAFRIIEGMNHGVSFFDTEGVVWYMNDWNIQHSAEPEKMKPPFPTCWASFHNFHHRSIRCPCCAVGLCLASDGENKATETLLPIGKSLHMLHMAATPWYSHRPPGRLLGATECVLDVTDTWERGTWKDRVTDVAEALVSFGASGAGSGGLAFDIVRVYGVGVDGGCLVGVHSSRAEEDEEFARWVGPLDDQLPDAYQRALRLEEVPIFTGASPFRPTAPGGHWAVVGARSDGQRGPAAGIVEFGHSGAPIDQAALQDLAPYVAFFAEALPQVSRESDAARVEEMMATVEAFAHDASKTTDPGGMLKLAGERLCSRLAPVMWHFRIIDREKMSLVLQKGEGHGQGCYFELADLERPLQVAEGGVRSLLLGRPSIQALADPERIAVSVNHELTDSEQEQLGAIRSYATFPLLWEDCWLGTMNVQFHDNSLLRESTVGFLTDLQRVLSEGLGRAFRHRAQQREISFLRQFRPERYHDETDAGSGQVRTDVLRDVLCVLRQVTDSRGAFVLEHADAHGTPALSPDTPEGQTELELGCAAPGRESPAWAVWDEWVDWTSVKYVRDATTNEWFSRCLDACRNQCERAFFEGTRSILCVPVIARDDERVLVVAHAPVPNWLHESHVALASHLSRLAGFAIDGLGAVAEKARHIRLLGSVSQVRDEMGRTPEEPFCLDQLLLAATSPDCLGFARALVLMGLDSKKQLRGVSAAGAWPIGSAFLQDGGENAGGPPPVREASRVPPLRVDHIKSIAVQLEEEPSLVRVLASDSILVRQVGTDHPLATQALVHLLGEMPYVVVPIRTSSNRSGVLIAAASSSDAGDLDALSSGILRLLTQETGVLLQKIAIAKAEGRRVREGQIARGIGHALNRRLALLQADLRSLWVRLQSCGMAERLLMEKRELSQHLGFLGRASNLFRQTIRSGLVPYASPIDLAHLLVKTARLLESGSNRRIVVRTPEQSTLVRGDWEMLEEAFAQILSNALEFDKSGGPIRVDVEADSSEVYIQISDCGPGVHPGVKRTLFTFGGRWPDTRLGVGLSFVRTVIEDGCGGSIEEVGKPKQGACFVARIPRSSVRET